jgi:hypothetical protein
MVYADEYILPLCDDRMHQGVEDNLSNAETAQTLIEAFIEHAPRQYIIIDGLDECESNEARQTAHFFMQLVARCDNDVKLGQLRVLFTSQTMLELSKHMPEGDASIPLKPTDNAEDIRTYVQKRMAEFSASDEFNRGFNLSDADRNQMESIVCHQSQGKFSTYLSSVLFDSKLTFKPRHVSLCTSHYGVFAPATDKGGTARKNQARNAPQKT